MSWTPITPIWGWVPEQYPPGPVAPGMGPGGDETTPTNIGRGSQPETVEGISQGGGLPPMCVNGTWIYDLPVDLQPYNPRRTESHWGAAGVATLWVEGDTLTYQGKYIGVLGPAGQDDNNWHVIWQLHGPVNGEWPSPAFGMNVRHGEIRLGGGDGHPNHNYSTNNYEWSQTIAAWQDDTQIDIKVTAFLTTNPANAWISVWVNGAQKLNKYKPISPQGNQPGTIYPGQPWVMNRTGLYRGTQAGATPTYRQTVAVQVSYHAGE